MGLKFNYCPQCTSALISRLVDGRDRKVCPDESCGFVFWNNPVPVVAIVPDTGEGIVLAHNRLWPKGIFSVITGFIEGNESPDEAAVRELQEELGLEAISVSFLGNFIFQKRNQLIVAYHIHVQGTVKLNEELDDFIVVPRERLAGWNKSKKFEVGEWLNSLRILED
jgi:NAD+ diphosphatase